MPGIDSLQGNADVIAVLERYLAVAREGRMSYVALVGLQEPDSVTGFFGGCDQRLSAAREAVGKLGILIDTEILNRTLPDRDESLGADYVCYPYAAAPASFDFLVWLIDQEMTRIRAGAPAPLKVAFWFGRDGKTGLNTPARVQMFEKVCRPSLDLIGAVEDDRAMLGRYKPSHTTREIVASARAGERVPILRAPTDAVETVREALRGQPSAVTITLREAEHWSHRNSNIGAWTRFAADLRLRGYFPVFVRDTRVAFEPLEDFATSPLASIDLHVRMALYECAAANLFISNGPGSLANFSDRPWLEFVNLQPDGHLFAPETPNFYRESLGIEPGAQFPWSREDQRIVWSADSYEAISEAWEKFPVR